MDAAGLDVRAAGAHQYDATLAVAGGSREVHVVVEDTDLEVLGVTATQEPLAVRAALEHVVAEGDPGSLPERVGLGDLARSAPGLVLAVRAVLG